MAGAREAGPRGAWCRGIRRLCVLLAVAAGEALRARAIAHALLGRGDCASTPPAAGPHAR